MAKSVLAKLASKMPARTCWPVPVVQIGQPMAEDAAASSPLPNATLDRDGNIYKKATLKRTACNLNLLPPGGAGLRVALRRWSSKS